MHCLDWVVDEVRPETCKRVWKGTQLIDEVQDRIKLQQFVIFRSVRKKINVVKYCDISMGNTCIALHSVKATKSNENHLVVDVH